MTMILKKDFTSFNYRLFVLPAFTRAFFIKGSPHGELSYNIKNEPVLISYKLTHFYVIFKFLLDITYKIQWYSSNTFYLEFIYIVPSVIA